MGRCGQNRVQCGSMQSVVADAVISPTAAKRVSKQIRFEDFADVSVSVVCVCGWMSVFVFVSVCVCLLVCVCLVDGAARWRTRHYSRPRQPACNSNDS